MSQNELTVKEIGRELEVEHLGIDQLVTGISPLGLATAGQLTFVTDPDKYAGEVVRALDHGAVLLFPAGHQTPEVAGASLIVVGNPRAAFARAVSVFFAPRVEAGVAATAVVHATAHVSPTAHVGEYSVIGPGAVVGDGVEIRHHVVIAGNVRIGAGSLVKSHAVIGEEGFGIDKDSSGNNVRLPHLGSVVLGGQVEIGNFTTVCSGTITPTKVGDFTKIDDHVHISHNCDVGANVIITACAEISGSVTIGDRTWIGPNAAVIQGVSIGSDVLVGIGAVVIKSIPDAEVQFGNPSRRIRDNA